MTIETWDRQPLSEQERVIGRTKAEGAPLSGGTEFSQPDFSLKGRGDEPLVATDAHVRMVHPDNNGGVRMLRRGYNFVDGSNGLGRMDAGLFFLAFVVDPRTHFIPMQTRLGTQRRAERVHPAHRVGTVRHPAGHRPRRVRGPVPLRLTPLTPDSWPLTPCRNRTLRPFFALCAGSNGSAA